MKQLTQAEFTRISDLVKQGMSYTKIARTFTSEGYRTARGKNINGLIINKIALKNGLRRLPSRPTQKGMAMNEPLTDFGDQLTTIREIIVSNLGHSLKKTIVKEIARNL